MNTPFPKGWRDNRREDAVKGAKPLPGHARPVYAAFGIFFIGVALTIAIITSPMEWPQWLVVLVLLAIGIDSIVGAVRNRWPIYSSFYI